MTGGDADIQQDRMGVSHTKERRSGKHKAQLNNEQPTNPKRKHKQPPKEDGGAIGRGP
jgi:hypothetical protein